MSNSWLQVNAVALHQNDDEETESVKLYTPTIPQNIIKIPV